MEGLVFALAPSRIEVLVAALRALTLEQRRLCGLAALACGGVCLTLAKVLGG